MRRLLKGLVIDEQLEPVLGNPASVLVYDEGGNIQVKKASNVSIRLAKRFRRPRITPKRLEVYIYAQSAKE